MKTSNTEAVFKAWKSKKSFRLVNSVWTDGYKIYSYHTPILYKVGRRVILDVSKYSHTTGTVRNKLITLLGNTRYTKVTIPTFRAKRIVSDYNDSIKELMGV